MAVKFTKRNFSEAEYIYDLASTTSKFFNESEYNEFMQKDPEEALTYTYLHAGLSNKDTSNFNEDYYNKLNTEDKLMYINNEYYTDRNEIAVDDETGEKYNVYNATKEYLDYKYEEAVDREYFESLSGFQKVVRTIGGVAGNALNAVYSTLEGFSDLILLVAGWISDIGNGKDSEASKILRDALAMDATGTREFDEKLQEFARRNTYIDKSKAVGIINDVVSGLAQMAPLAIPGAGQAIYYGSMAGNTAGQAVYENPDIDSWALAGYTIGSTAIEFATEKISGKVFGGSSVDVWFGGKSGTGNAFSRFAKSFVSEGFEESVSEYTGSILHDVLVDGQSITAAIGNVSMSDVLYAGLIGGLIGGIGTGVEIASTQNLTITKDGQVYTDKQLKENGISVDGTRLSKSQSLNFKETFNEVESLVKDTNANVNKLLAKYSSSNVEQIKKDHAKEYQNAITKDRKLLEKKADAVSSLAKILDVVGLEGFQKATDLLSFVVEKRAAEADKYVNTFNGRTAEFKNIEEQYKRKNPGVGIKITGNIDSARIALKNSLKREYGVDVYFADIGWKNGVVERRALTLDENTIIIDNTTFDTMSREELINTVVKEELVHTLQYESGILSPKNMYNLLKIVQALNGQDVTPVELDAAYDEDGKVEKISERQAKALAQTLLFDEITVSKIFICDNPTFTKTYQFLRKLKDGLFNKKRTKKDTAKYRQVLISMKMYRNAAIKQLGNVNDVMQLAFLLNLSPEEEQELLNTFDPNFDTAHYSWIRDSYHVNVTKRKAAQEFLIKQRIDLNNNFAIKDPTTFNNALYRNIFDPDRYTQTARNAIFEFSRPENMEKMTEEELRNEFQYSLQDYLLSNFGIIINKEEQCLLNTFDMKVVVNDAFVDNMSDLSDETPNALDGYTTLSQIFDDSFVAKFAREDGTNPLDEVSIQIIHSDTDVRKKGGYTPSKKLITLTIPKFNGRNLNAEIYDNFLHEVHHALSDIQNLPLGTSPEKCKGFLRGASNEDIAKLATMLMTKSAYEEFKNSPSILRDYVAYGIYRITDGEFTAEAYATSKIRRKDFEKRLKGGAAFNRSGFRVYDNGLSLQGYGRFKNFSFTIDKPAEIRSRLESKNLLQPKYVVSYAKENKLVKTLKESNVDVNSQYITDEFRTAINNKTKQNIFDVLFADKIVKDTTPSNERTKIINAVVKYLKGKNNVFAVLWDSGIPTDKWSDKLKFEIGNITNEQLYELISQDDVTNKEASTSERRYLTNLVIDYVTEGKNKHMRTITDVDETILYGLPYFELYIKHVIDKNTDIDASHSFDEIKNAVETKLKDQQIRAELDKEQRKNTELSDKEQNRIIRQKLIKMDFDYSIKAYRKLETNLTSGLTEQRQFGLNHNITRGDETENETEINEASYEMNYDESPKQLELTRQAVIAVRNQVLAQQDSPDIFKTRDKFENTLKDKFIADYGQHAYEQVLKWMPKKSNLDRKVNSLKEKIKTSNLQDTVKNKFLNTDTSNFGATQYKQYITDMETALSTTEQTKTIVNKPVVETAETKTVIESPKKEPVSEKKDTTAKQKTEELFTKNISTYASKKTMSSDDLANKIISSVESSPEILNEVQKVSTQQKHAVISNTLLNSLIPLGTLITKENFVQVRSKIAASDSKFAGEALNLFDEIVKNSAFEDAEFAKFIDEYYEKQVSLAGQKLSRHSKYVAEYKPVSNLIKTLDDHSFQSTVTQEMLEEYDARLKEKDKMISELDAIVQQNKELVQKAIETDDKIEELNAEISEKQKQIDELKNKSETSEKELEDLKQQIKNNQETITNLSNNNLTEEERLNLIAEAKKASDDKAILQNGSAIDIADWLIRNVEDLEEAYELLNSITDAIIRKAVQIHSNGGEIDVHKKSASNTDIHAFPNARDWLLNKLKKLRSYRMWAMLSSPVTWVRNAVNNGGMTFLDRETGLFEQAFTEMMSRRGMFSDGTQLKYRSTTAGKEAYNLIQKRYKYTIQALMDGDDVSKYQTMTGEKAGKIKRELLKKQKNEASGFGKILAEAQLAVDWGLSTGPLGDNAFVMHAIIRNFADLLVSNMDVWVTRYSQEADVLRKKKSLTEKQEQRLIEITTFLESPTIDNLLDVMPSEDVKPLMDNAKARAFEQFFKNSSKLNEWLMQLGKQHPVLGELISWVMPFPKVAINVLKLSVNYSPLGFLKALVQFNKAKQAIATGKTTGFEFSEIARTLSQSTVGTINFVAGVILLALGFIEIDEDDYMGPSLKIGDLKISLSELAPATTSLSIGSAMMWAWKNDKSATKAALDVIYDNTLLGNVENIFRYSSSDQYFQNLSISYMSQYIPNCLKVVTKLTDWETKDKSGNYWNKMIKTLGSYLPGISHAVPSKIDPYTGKPVYRAGAQGWINILNSVSPVSVKTTKQSELEETAETLGAETTGLSGAFTINDKNYKVTNNEKNELAKYRANYINSTYNSYVSGKTKVTVKQENGKFKTTTWDKLTEKEKKSALQNLYTKATTITKIKYWLSKGNAYYTSDRDEYLRLKQQFNNSQQIQYKKNWKTSKFVEK